MVLELKYYALKLHTDLYGERVRGRKVAHKTGSKYLILPPQVIGLM